MTSVRDETVQEQILATHQEQILGASPGDQARNRQHKQHTTYVL